MNRRSFHLAWLAFALSLSASRAVETKKPEIPPKALNECEAKLREFKQDPAELKRTVTYWNSPEKYFSDKPQKDLYWDDGRRSVGRASFFVVAYGPKEALKGNITCFFVDAQSGRLLWTYRGK